MSETLDTVKDRLRISFLGKGGIHGMGISRAKSAIRVYLAPNAGREQQDLLDQIREEAKPFAVIVVHEDRPVTQ